MDLLSSKLREEFKKTTLIAAAGMLLFLFIMPVPAEAAGSFSYRSTVFGTDVRHVGNDVYEIVNPQTNFSVNDNVYTLTRIFNITNVDSFRYRAELYGDGRWLRNWNSQTFYPRGSWWSENYVWNNYGRLERGNYQLKMYISQNNESESLFDIKNFSVGDYNDYNSNYNNDYYYHYDNYQYQPVYYDIHNDPYEDYSRYSSGYYDYEWTNTGAYVRNLYSWVYDVPNQKINFSTNENVVALTKIANIRRVESFQIKHEIYLDTNQIYRRNESQIFNPRLATWRDNYSSSNFGRLPAGTHKLKTFISVNKTAYRLLNSKTIYVSNSAGQIAEPRYQPASYKPYYSYDWSRTDDTVRHVNGYVYDTPNQRKVFYSDEDINILTKLGAIRYVDKFQIKHELYQDNSASVYKTKISDIRYPNGSDWDYNYASSNFGRLPVGSHRIKVHISVNNSSYKLLDTVNFRVQARYQPSGYQEDKPSYNFTNIIYSGNGNGYYYQQRIN